MSVLVGPVAIVAAGSVQVETPARQPGEFSHVVLDNATPYVLTIQTGGNGRAIPPFTADVMQLDTSSLFLTGVFSQVPGGPVSTPQSYLEATFYTDDDELPSGLPTPLTSQLIQAAITGAVALQAGAVVGIDPAANTVAVPGGVGITGTPNVAVTNTPTVGISTGATVGISGTPNVAVPGGVGITGTATVSVSNTPTVGLSVGATVGISGTPTVVAQGAATTLSPPAGTPSFAQRSITAASTANVTSTNNVETGVTLVAAPGLAKVLELHKAQISVTYIVGSAAVAATHQLQLIRSDNNAVIWAGTISTPASQGSIVSATLDFDFEGAQLPANVGVKYQSTVGVGSSGSAASHSAQLNYTTLS